MALDRRSDQAVALFLAMTTFFGGVAVGSVAQDHVGKPICGDKNSEHDHRRYRVTEPVEDARIQARTYGVDSSRSSYGEGGLVVLDRAKDDSPCGYQTDQGERAGKGCTKAEGLEEIGHSDANPRLVHRQGQQQPGYAEARRSEHRDPVHMSVSGRLGGSHPQCYRQTGTTADQADFSVRTRFLPLFNVPVRVVAADLVLESGPFLP